MSEETKVEKPTAEQIAAILASHNLWIAGQEGGTRANLTGANLTRANLTGANLTGANLTEVKEAALVLARTEIVPREGEVIGWKKCCSGVIVKVRVPPEAKRSNALGRKCRAEFVEVLEVTPPGKTGVSMHDFKTEYIAGQLVRAHNWNTNRLEECAPGIHFFLTREEAEAYRG